MLAEGKKILPVGIFNKLVFKVKVLKHSLKRNTIYMFKIKKIQYISFKNLTLYYIHTEF